MVEAALQAVQRDLRALLGSLPIEAQNASGLSRRLEIERTTCQRTVSAANLPTAGLELAAQLPGTEGLRAIVAAARRVWRSNADCASAATTLAATIDQYADVVQRTAGSRARLLARIEATMTPARGAEIDANAHAEQLFDAAAALTGRHSQTWLAVHIYEPTERRDRITQTRAHGLIRHCARADAVPLTFHVFATAPAGAEPGDDADSLGRFEPLLAAVDDQPAELLRAFSTWPPPFVRTRQPNEFLVQTVDAATPDRACDLLFGLRGSMVHPASAPPYLEEVWALINFPVRWLLLDVFLHREIARQCIPGLDVHLWRPDFAQTIGERWQTRFSASPRLEVLGAALQQAESPAYARQAELLEFLFAQRGLDANEYVGFRCQVRYPMWRTGYRVTFDFSGG